MPANKLFVKNLPPGTTAAQIESWFKRYGARKAGIPATMQGCAIVTLETEEEARRAVRETTDLTIQGHELSIMIYHKPKGRSGRRRYPSASYPTKEPEDVVSDADDESMEHANLKKGPPAISKPQEETAVTEDAPYDNTTTPTVGLRTRRSRIQPPTLLEDPNTAYNDPMHKKTFSEIVKQPAMAPKPEVKRRVAELRMSQVATPVESRRQPLNLIQSASPKDSNTIQAPDSSSRPALEPLPFEQEARAMCQAAGMPSEAHGHADSAVCDMPAEARLHQQHLSCCYLCKRMAKFHANMGRS